MQQCADYIARVQHVQEVTLAGTADLGYWRDRLREEDLHPAALDGRAQVVLGATSLRFCGLPSNELCVAVAASLRAGSTAADGMYLARAFNSSRILAWMERAFFRTPYETAGVRIAAGDNVSVELVPRGGASERPELSLGGALAGRERLGAGDECWEGPIFLPPAPRRRQRRELFFARLEGYTERYRFEPQADRVHIEPSVANPCLRWLIESRFSPLSWSVRRDATHARSRTFPRVTAPLQSPPDGREASCGLSRVQ